MILLQLEGVKKHSRCGGISACLAIRSFGYVLWPGFICITAKRTRFFNTDASLGMNVMSNLSVAVIPSTSQVAKSGIPELLRDSCISFKMQKQVVLELATQSQDQSPAGATEFLKLLTQLAQVGPPRGETRCSKALAVY